MEKHAGGICSGEGIKRNGFTAAVKTPDGFYSFATVATLAQRLRAQVLSIQYECII